MKQFVSISIILLSFAAPLFAAAPPTESKPVTDVIHGVEIVDPYRWLEGSAAPELKGPDRELDAKVSAWTDVQNDYTREVLDKAPGRAQVEARIRQLMEIDSISTPQARRNRYFIRKREGKQAQPITYVQEGLNGTPRPLLDPMKIDPSGLTTISWTVPNHDATLMAFGMYRAGDENSTAYVMNVDTGEWLAEEIPGKVFLAGWMPDSSGFFYIRLADLKNPYSRQIKYHKLGTHHRQDPVLFEQYKEGPLATTYGPSAGISVDGRWMLLSYGTGANKNDLWVIDLDRWFRTGEFVRRDIIVGEDAAASGTIVGNTFFMQTTLGAPNGKVVAVDLNHPERANWKELIRERKDATLTSVNASRSFIATSYLKSAASHLELFHMDGRPARVVELPGIGTAGLSVTYDRDEAFLSYTSFNEPGAIYRYDLATGGRELWERPDVPVDPSLVEVKQVVYKSKDGTKVPMFLAYKKGLKLDGNNPTILYGYGGFSVSYTPTFNAALFPWYEAGGVYAMPALRGGGEFGEEWHRGGMLDKKQNTFDDFIAAAEWLIANKYTSPKRLAIAGGSNGGLLTGAVLVQRPELFSAVVVGVPLLDMLRYQNFLMAKYWVPEYGSSDDPNQFAYLRKYSPYQNVKKGVAYPSVLLTAGENDSRVHALHARKMTALLRDASTSNQDEKPILLWVDRSAGHGQGKPLDLRVRDVVDQRIFIMKQLGMLDK